MHTLFPQVKCSFHGTHKKRLSVDSSYVQPFTSRPKCIKRDQHFTAARNCSVPSTVPMLTELTSALRHYVETLGFECSSVGPTPTRKYGKKCDTATQRRFSLKIATNPKVSVKQFYTELHENPTSSWVADMLKEDGRGVRIIHSRAARKERLKPFVFYFVENAYVWKQVKWQDHPAMSSFTVSVRPAVIRLDVVTAVKWLTTPIRKPWI
jgi:inhibitor of KinA sporulation pathway (predicted exonuclease)